VWPHRAHSNVRCSKPSGPAATANVIIRAWQSGHRGRCIGNSSGGGFSTPSMTIHPTMGCACRQVKGPALSSLRSANSGVFDHNSKYIRRTVRYPTINPELIGYCRYMRPVWVYRRTSPRHR
jgi:hypothetical protein